MLLKTMLDSGAYSAFRQGKVIDIDEYAEFVKTNGHNYDACITLDVINDAKSTYRNWLYLRKKGVDVLPVYHLGTDEKWLRKYLEVTDHICLGAIANLSTKARLEGLTYIWEKYLVDENKMPKVKVHGLGLTAVAIMLQYPWHSVDSMTPLISAVFGRIFLPFVKGHGEQWVEDYFGGFFVAVSDQSKRKKVLTDYAGLPYLMEEQYNGMFEEKEFDLGQIYYIEKRLTRKDKARLVKDQELEDTKGHIQKKQGLLEIELPKPILTDAETLANSWWCRLDWNIRVWGELVERMPAWPRPMLTPDEIKLLPQTPNKHAEKTIVYFGVSTSSHLRRMTMADPRPDILTSYAFMTDEFLTSIIRHKYDSSPITLGPTEPK